LATFNLRSVYKGLKVHSVTDRRTDDSIMAIADHTAYSTIG